MALEQITNGEQVGFSSERLGRIGPVMQRHIDQRNLAGIRAILIRRGAMVYDGCAGLADIEAGRPVAPGAIYRLYSMTKPVTAVAALSLYEQACFHLDDPVARYLPAFANQRVVADPSASNSSTVPATTEMTVRHLMTHTSGIAYGGDHRSAIGRAYLRSGLGSRDMLLSEFCDVVATLPLAFQPGSRWLYGFSIDVLGRLVEVWSGMPFGAYLKEALFGPLGLVDTAFVLSRDQLRRLGACYASEGDGPARLVRMEAVSIDGLPRKLESGGGGLLGTAEDYARFAQMLCKGGELDGVRILGPKTVEMMATNQLAPDLMPFIPESWPYSRGVGMGLGVRVNIDQGQTQILGSPGAYTWQGAASTDVWVDPQEQMVGLCFAQRLPGWYDACRDLRVLAYAALTG